MTLKIYRGTQEIGGTCIEIKAANGTTLWADLGEPLESPNADVGYAHTQHPDALLISHPHSDHYGLMECLDHETPIYISQISRDLINASRIFRGAPSVKGDYHLFTAWQPFTINDTFRVTPYLVDHSVPDAFAFLIEADGKRIFYSGDFRGTGRKSILFDNLLQTPPQPVDVLLIEGTMVERSNDAYPCEADVEHGIYEMIKNQQNVSFVVSSAQNVDRFVSVFRACKKANKHVVVDIYNAYVLDVVKKKSPRLPTIDWDNVKVYQHPKQWEYIQDNPAFADFRRRIEQQSVGKDVFAHPADYVYFLRCPNENLINRLRQQGHQGKMNLIYSQWSGYLTDAHRTYFTDTINRLKEDADFNFKHIHTSGHASLTELQMLSKALSPTRIIPIHTNNPTKFRQEFKRAGFHNTYLCLDNKDYEL